jgi:hypothetical protein
MHQPLGGGIGIVHRYVHAFELLTDGGFSGTDVASDGEVEGHGLFFYSRILLPTSSTPSSEVKGKITNSPTDRITN